MKSKSQSKNDQNSNPQPDPQQKRSVLWIGVLLFISGWVFFLGVIVGRGTAPALFDYQKIETEIATLAKTFTDGRKVQNDLETDILTTQVGLEYPEELKKKTDVAAKWLIPALDNPIRPTETPKAAHPSPAPENPLKSTETAKAAQHVAALDNPVRPAEAPKQIQTPPPPPVKSEPLAAIRPEAIEHAPDAVMPGPEVKIKSMYDLKKASQPREPAPERTLPPAPDRTSAAAPERAPAASPKSPPPASDNKPATAQPVAIHMASLVDKKSADALIENLRSKGISASKTPKMIPGKGIWYTVVIGKYASSTEADAMLNRLKQENVEASLVRQ
jgi:septal ring-binding cell division protein DamX